MHVNRRQFLKSSAAYGIALLAPFGYGIANASTALSQFKTPLKLPPLVEGRLENNRRIFDLTLRTGLSNLLGNIQTPTAGINSDFLGPVIRVQRGDDVKLNVSNHLFEPSTLHWHGLNLPAAMDGGPHQVIQPGETWSPEFKIRQAASTQWYHSHMYHRTGIQVYYGLAGLFYIDEKDNDALNLPSEYGIDDIPLILQDRSFNQDGSFRYLSSMHDRMNGAMGSVMLVNGTRLPVFMVQKQLTRFRILNGSNARIYNLEFGDKRQFLQIASDGGLLETPARLNSIILAPGERAELLVEFSNQENVMLQHKPLPKRANSRAGMMGMMQNMMTANDQPFAVIRFESDRPLTVSKSPTNQRISQQNWSVKEVAKTRQFNLNMQMGMMRGGGFTINGRSMDMNRIDARVRLGDIEIWEIINDSPMPHPFHIHDTQFRVLDRDGKQPPANELGLKDTVLVNSGERVRIITQFQNYADSNTPYMFHCHNLEHEDAGMMGQFVVEA
jgi:blue copper oxidase